ncbi:hypothetical protein [Corallococcus sp. M7]
MPRPTKPLSGSAVLTETKKYGIFKEGTHPRTEPKSASLFVNTKVEEPKFHRFGEMPPSPTLYTRGKDTFERFEFPKGVDDCMHNAEEFMHQRELALPTDKTYSLSSKEKVTGRVLGATDRRNINASRKAAETAPDQLGVHAKPEPGEAFGIIRQGKLSKVEAQSPYHFAPVVARDGRHTITAEQTAGTSNATGARDQYPVMDRYTDGAPRASFQGRYGTQGGYGTDAITVVAQKHGPDEFSEE